MTATRSPTTNYQLSNYQLASQRFTWRSTFGGRNQVSEAARFEVRLPRSMRQMPPFLKASARPAPMRCAASSSEIRLVANERDAPSLRDAGQLRHHRRGRMARRERIEHLDRRLAVQAGGEDLRRLPRAHERAGEDFVHGDVEAPQALDRVLEAVHAPLGEGAFGIVGPLAAALGGDRMANAV